MARLSFSGEPQQRLREAIEILARIFGAES